MVAECLINGTRQSWLCRNCLWRVLFAECYTRRTICRMFYAFCRVFWALGKLKESGRVRIRKQIRDGDVKQRSTQSSDQMRLIFLIIILGACATPTSSSFPLKIELLFSTPLKFQKNLWLKSLVVSPKSNLSAHHKANRR